jgi:hypothetical protein
MTYREAEQLRNRLDNSGVTLKMVPRGDRNKRGVPDSVIWIEPTELSASDMFPILVELEGRFSNVDDFEKFARRNSADEPYPHHLNLVSLETITDEYELLITYDVATVGHRLLSTGSSGDLNEPEFHNAVRDWKREQESSFHTSARISTLHGTRIVWWKVSFSIYGHHFKTEIPFIVDVGFKFSDTFPLYASRIVIPAVAVTTNEDSHWKNEVNYPTSIRFRRSSNKI